MPGLTESCIATCSSRLIYETLTGKEVLRFADFIGGRLPVVRAGGMGSIPYKYRAGLRSGAHRFDHDLARADYAGTAAPCTSSIPGL